MKFGKLAHIFLALVSTANVFANAASDVAPVDEIISKAEDIIQNHDVKNTSPSRFLNSEGILNLEKIDEELQQCQVVKDLTELLVEEEQEDSWLIKTYGYLFPFGPGANAILATTYISGPPNLFLALIPSNINKRALSLLVSFAVGGLLGDVFLHLLPEVFFGESEGDKLEFQLVDERRNTVLGLGIFVGFIMFFTFDKLMRIMQMEVQDDEDEHEHSTGISSSTEINNDNGQLRNRKKVDTDNKESEAVVQTQEIKNSTYLNLLADFTHNITDGIAMSASFYISRPVGAMTCIAVFFHEIPHEIGDFALLIGGGFTKKQAMSSQFITAIGAYLGTFLGIAVHNYSYLFASENSTLFGTTVTLGDLSLPFTAGTFLYIATVGVIPEILEVGDEQEEGHSHGHSHSHASNDGVEIKKRNRVTRMDELINTAQQLFFTFVGIAIMFGVTWLE